MQSSVWTRGGGRHCSVAKMQAPHQVGEIGVCVLNGLSSVVNSRVLVDLHDMELSLRTEVTTFVGSDKCIHEGLRGSNATIPMTTM